MTGHRAEPHITKQRAGLAALGTAVALAAVTVPPLVLSGQDPARVTGGPPAASVPAYSSPPATTPSPSLTVTAAPSSSSAAPSPVTTTRLTPPATLKPVKVEAEAVGNLLLGGPEVTSCATCSGGQRVRYIDVAAQLVVRTSLPAAARRLTVIYEAEGPRTIKISINGVPLGAYPVFGASWDSPQTFDVAVNLPPGQVAITFYNDESPTPDIDAVIIS